MYFTIFKMWVALSATQIRQLAVKLIASKSSC
jgi:hypothetical protein